MKSVIIVLGGILLVVFSALLIASVDNVEGKKGGNGGGNGKGKATPTPTNPAGQVAASVETDPMPHRGDAADDLAIWIHPDDPSQSVIIGTDKKRGGGLAVYDLQGNQIQFLSEGEPNNVDLRYNFPLGGQLVALVTAGDRDDDTVAIYRLNPTTRLLENVSAGSIRLGIEIYGSCMYHSPITGKYFFFVNSKEGEVEQWELVDDGNGLVTGTMARAFDVGEADTEGCVADDELAYFYISEEDVGIWKYGAEPGDGTARVLVDLTGSGGHLTADVEGLTLYYTSTSTGYLLASSQGSSEFVIYSREGNNDYIATFAIVAGNGIDRVTETDGIDVTNFPLGPDFAQGLFVVQDGKNDDGNQNFKLVPWQTIAGAVDPALVIDTTWDPRLVGSPNP